MISSDGDFEFPEKENAAEELPKSSSSKKVPLKRKASKSLRDQQKSAVNQKSDTNSQSVVNKKQSAKITQSGNSKLTQEGSSKKELQKVPEKSSSAPKIPPEVHPADLLTIDDVSTAGSSMTTDDDDFFFSGGLERHKERHLNHRIKKLQKKKDELRAIKVDAKEISLKVRKKVKFQILDSENSTGDEEEFMPNDSVRKDLTVRVEERKRADDRKRVEEQKKLKTTKKKAYEICDTDSSD
jgi:hypothetical protein